MAKADELKELAELEELAQLEELEAQEQSFAPSIEEMDQARAAVEPTTGEALSGGFIEGVPFLKDAVASYDGIADAMEDDNLSFDAAYGNYKENLDEIDRDLSNAEAQSPATFMAGEIAGTAGALVGGGAALKGAGAAGTLTPLGMVAATGAGVGAAQGLSRSRDRGVSDVLVGGTIGAVSEVVSPLIGKGIKKGGRYLLDKAGDIKAGAVKKILGIGNVSTKKSFHKHLKRTNQKESVFLNDILTQKMKGSDELVLNFNEKPELMIDKIKIRRNEIGDKIGKSYKQIDEAHKIEINLEELKSGLTDDVVAPFMRSDDPGMVEIGAELNDFINKLGHRSKGIKKEFKDGVLNSSEEIVIDEKWGLARTHKLQKDIRKRIETIYKKNGLDLNASKEQQRQVATSLGKHMDEVLETVSSEADDLVGKIKKDRLQFGNMSTIKETLEADLYRSKGDSMSALKEFVSTRNVLISGIISGGFTGVIGPAGLVAGPILTSIIHSPKTPLYLAKGLQSLGNVVSASPTGEIATKVNSAALMNNKKFKDTMYGVIGEMNLKSDPIQRTSEDVINKQADIRHYIKANQPSALKGFDDAIKAGPEAINAYMDGVSKIDGVQDMFEDGVGFDGKVYSKEDKATLKHQLKLSNVPGAQRVQLINDLEANGTIPDMTQVVEAPPKQHVSRTKKIHDY